MIDIKDLRKEFKRNVKGEGLKGSLINIIHPHYENKVAVDDISFHIDSGELVGYIGANGAGKSTTIKMLTGILTPTSGEVRVNGLIPQKDRIKNNFQIGTVFGQRSQLWWDIPAVESYKLLRRIYEIPDNIYKENMDRFIEVLDLKDLIHVPLRQLSLGQKMRCEIVAAFLHNPKVVYLDEPTIGLDVMVKDKIRKFINTLNRENRTTIILTTHDMQDIEEICRRIIIIHSGKILYDGNIDDVKRLYGKNRIMKLNLKGFKGSLESVFTENRDILELIYKDETNFHIRFSGEKITASSVIQRVSPYCEISDLSIEEPSIESVVKELFGKLSN